MCGICGIYNHGSREPVDSRVLEEMTARMTHRGPDDQGFLVDDDLGLGARRLSIIDIAGGAQPIENEDGSVIVVMNGEIYNFLELRQRLESHGHDFRTRCDTEVVVHAYEQWGFAGLDRLNGMFGLAIWDKRERRLVVARDPLGIKPIYYAARDDKLIFASEIRAILTHPEITREVDSEAIAEFLGLTYVRSPRTAFAGIRKVRPGHAVICDASGLRRASFVSQRPRPRPQVSEAAVVHELRDRIERAIDRQCVADVPVGVALSGGIDSATIATLMAVARHEPIDTFTVGFGEEFRDDESNAARETAARIGSRHHEVTIRADAFAEWLPQAIWHMEEPVATSQTLPFFKLCELARDHVTVLLTGQGADEAFAGYPRHLGEYHGWLYRALPEGVRQRVLPQIVSRMPRNEQLKRAVASLDTPDDSTRRERIYSVIDNDLKRRLLNDGSGPGRNPGPWDDDIESLDDLNKMLYIDARTSLADNLLMYGDKMSMAVSVEARVPFLDLELMTLAESLPAALKVRGSRQKVILKKAMEAWLPSAHIHRRKVGFETPIDGWLRREMRGHIEQRLLDRDAGCRSHFDADVIREMIRDHERGRQDHKRTLFGLLTFEIWHEQFIKPAAWQAKPAAV